MDLEGVELSRQTKQTRGLSILLSLSCACAEESENPTSPTFDTNIM